MGGHTPWLYIMNTGPRFENHSSMYLLVNWIQICREVKHFG